MESEYTPPPFFNAHMFLHLKLSVTAEKEVMVWFLLKSLIKEQEKEGVSVSVKNVRGLYTSKG